MRAVCTTGNFDLWQAMLGRSARGGRFRSALLNEYEGDLCYGLLGCERRKKWRSDSSAAVAQKIDLSSLCPQPARKGLHTLLPFNETYNSG